MQRNPLWARIVIAGLAAIAVAAWVSHRQAAEVAPEVAPIVTRAERTAQITAPPARALVVQLEQPGQPVTTPEAALGELVAEAKRLQALARYPRWSQPLRLLGDPFTEDDALQVQSAGPEGPVLTVYAEHRVFDAPEPVMIRAHVMTPGGVVAAQLTATVLDGTAQRVQDLVFSSHAQGYLTSFTPAASGAANAGYSIRVRAVTADQQEREALLEIIYNHPYARLTGNFRDRLDHGDLVIEAEVSVQRAAQFRLNGSLYGGADEQIAWAEASEQLSVGSAWLPLRFHGLILREQRINGPYLLRSVALTTQTADAEAAMRAVQNAHLTQAYDADAFEGTPERDPQLLAEAAQLRAHIARVRAQLPADSAVR